MDTRVTVQVAQHTDWLAWLVRRGPLAGKQEKRRRLATSPFAEQADGGALKQPFRQEQNRESLARAPLAISNVALVCPTCKKRTRVGYTFKETKGGTVKVRVCKNKGCGQEIDK